jgi:hypothetical protein
MFVMVAVVPALQHARCADDCAPALEQSGSCATLTAVRKVAVVRRGHDHLADEVAADRRSTPHQEKYAMRRRRRPRARPDGALLGRNMTHEPGNPLGADAGEGEEGGGDASDGVRRIRLSFTAVVRCSVVPGTCKFVSATFRCLPSV